MEKRRGPPGMPAAQDCQLMAECNDFKFQFRAAAKQASES
jgi:hypothetical protein